MIITKTQYVETKRILSSIGKRNPNDSKESYFEQSSIVTTIRFLGIPVYRSIKPSKRY